MEDTFRFSTVDQTCQTHWPLPSYNELNDRPTLGSVKGRWDQECG